MPKVPHGSGLDARTDETRYLREKGFGHWELREGVTTHGGMRVEAERMPIPDFPRREHGWAAGFPISSAPVPPPSGDCAIGSWNFALACQSGHLLTAGF